ncbi:hypothetical protein HY382_01955 [Candidatus Curtissbacteria bacterium]|nr:hypothetical protein [Candidatus Curtissbacteria bacterium]
MEFFKYNEKHHLTDFINKKRFRVADTTLTYRQVNVLSKDKLLNDGRKQKEGWRKFSYKELVYLLLVDELKKFGVQHSQLKPLWKFFFEDQYASDMAIGVAMARIEITILFLPNGGVLFCDPINYLLYGSDKDTYIHTTLNKFVSKVSIKRDGMLATPKKTFASLFLQSAISVKEKQVIKLLRDKDFNSVRIKKKDGDISHLHAGRTMGNEKPISAEDLIKVIQKSDFQDVSLVKRNGKIVNLNTEQAFKL